MIIEAAEAVVTHAKASGSTEWQPPLLVKLAFTTRTASSQLESRLAARISMAMMGKKKEASHISTIEPQMLQMN